MEPLTLTATAQARCETLGLEFLAEFFEAELSLRPTNLQALSELAHLYTRLGRYGEGLDADRRLVRAAPDDPTVHYNLACSLALTGDPEGAFEALEASLDLGFDDEALLTGDDDLRSLREDPRFEALVERLRS